MIRSMTGFCKSEAVFENITCNIEIRSVNHRFFDAKVHLPRQFQYLEDKLKKQLKSSISRGKIDVYFQVDAEIEQTEKLSINPSLWENVKSTVKTFEKDLGKEVQINMSGLLGIKGLVVYEQEEKNLEDYEKIFDLAMEKGVPELLEMKKREGELLYKEIIQHVDQLQKLIEEIPKYREEIIEKQREKFEKNLKTLALKYDQNDPRIMQEIGIFLDRCDITEEIERFRTHLIQMRDLLSSSDPVGRKLDFLLQELNREANTLCSKSNHTSTTQTGVELKCEIEKIREQIQNIE
ncbi:MAG: YicC family protein [Proteobacteria bacterium]|nr:YicC family protein [Pseudomonadota bacterium]